MKFKGVKSEALIMTFGDPSGDPRPNRMVHLLHSQGFNVDILSPFCSSNLPVSNYFKISPMFRAHKRCFKRLRSYITSLGSKNISDEHSIKSDVSIYSNK